MKIDHILWVVIAMFQALKLITLTNIGFGLVLRDFLNDYLGGFMLQISIHVMPSVLIKESTYLERKYELYGIKSYVFAYYFVTTIIVLMGVMFFLTFTLAILECMKRTKSRRALMVAVANYLSINLWIRGFYQYSLTLSMMVMLDFKESYNEISILSIGSKVTIGIWILIMSLIIYHLFKSTRKEDTNVMEYSEPLKSTDTSIITYNIMFLVKRIIFAAIVTFFESAEGNLQIFGFILTSILCFIITAAFIRFKI